MARRSRALNPVVEHRRRLIIQTVGITILAIVAVILVIAALRMP